MKPTEDTKTLTLSPTPNRRAEFWSADELLVVIQFNGNDLCTANSIDIIAREHLSAAAGNCVNICS